VNSKFIQDGGRPPFSTPFQWRPQTIKSGSAFKGQLYFQVGQNGVTEGSVPEHRGKWVVGRSAVALPIGVWGYAPENFSKLNFEIAYFLHFAN